MFLSVLSGSSHLQSFPLIVEQLGDVPGHPLHQVLGVVPLDFELTLLFVVNLQTEETASSISFVKEVRAERLSRPTAGLYCRGRSVHSAITPMSSASRQNQQYWQRCWPQQLQADSHFEQKRISCSRPSWETPLIT